MLNEQDSALLRFELQDVVALQTQEGRERVRPFYLLRPKVFKEGNEWCCLYGENIQEGVAAFGSTPEQAAIQFDVEWKNAAACCRAREVRCEWRTF